MIAASPLIDSILNVHENFFKLFTPHNGMTIPAIGNDASTTIPVFYADEGSDGYSAIHREVYPQIVIQDFPPELDTEWGFVNTTSYEGFFGEKTNKQAYVFKEPIRVKFRYDVTAFTKNPYEKMRIQDTFMRNFFKGENVWLFNGGVIQTTQEDINYGVPISYTVIPTESIREDGIRELNYEFTFYSFIYYDQPIAVQLVEQFVLSINSRVTQLIQSATTQDVVIGSPVVLGDSHGIFQTVTAQFNWVWDHNFGFKPAINVYDSDGKTIIGYQRVDNSNNQLTLSFGLPMAGKIIGS